MSADLAAPTSQAPCPGSENLSLEDLRKEPLIQQFANMDEEIARHHSTLRLFSGICKMICEDGTE